MLITSHFVVINLPKTGSSFVRAVIKKIYARRRWRWGRDRFLKELILPSVGGSRRERGQHGRLRQVPSAYRHLPLVSVVRNPYEKLLSMFEYSWWKEHPFLPMDELVRIFPHFPHLSLDEFVQMIDTAAERTLGGSNPNALGRQTIQFVRFFFHQPDQVLPRLTDFYVDAGEFRRDMGDVTFLRQERLNDDLADYLARFDFSADELALCRAHPRVNRTRGVPNRNSLWTPTSVHYVDQKERLLLRMLESRGLSYAAPEAAAAARAS
jgi:hypothetical protein